MKLHIAIPAYSGQITVSTAHSLNLETRAMAAAGIESEVSFLPGMPLIHIVRNMQAYKFLYESDADKLVFVDADVGWRMGTLFHVAMHKEHVVAAGVRRRKDPEDYAVTFLESGTAEQDPKTGLIEIATIGMALTAITRKALQTFRDKTPELAYEFEGKQHHAFFQCPIVNGRAVGEDVYFCEKWREIGGKVFLDPRHWTTHTDGVKTYGGCIGQWLNRNVEQTKDAAE